MSYQPGQLGATELLSKMLADLSGAEHEEVGCGPLTSLPNGVTAEIHTPKDSWRVSIEWLGDHEGSVTDP